MKLFVLAAALLLSTSASASCISVGDVKEVINNGGQSVVITNGGTFIISKPLAILGTVGSEYRHAPACYNASTNTLTYTLPGGRGKASVKVE